MWTSTEEGQWTGEDPPKESAEGRFTDVKEDMKLVGEREEEAEDRVRWSQVSDPRKGQFKCSDYM